MKISGYALREALRRWQLRRDTALSQFDGSLRKFQDEDKDPPVQIMERLTRAESVIAVLQEQQTRYNLTVKVSPQGLEPMTLLRAVKLIGGIGRQEKLWRNVAAPTKSSRVFGERQDVRDKDQEVARATITVKDASDRAAQIARISGSLRAAIATANASEVELEIGSDLLE